jgi:biotin carboxylase
MKLKIFKRSPKKYFISIGSGINQLPLIEEASSMGFHVIGVDSDTSAPGFTKCSLKIQESVENHEDIFKKISELMLDGEIKGILSKSYGKAVSTACFLAEKYRIPLLPYDRSLEFLNKKKMKNTFRENGILTPKQFIVKSKNRIGKIGEDKFPVIMKPSSGHGKTDVRMIKSLEELKKILMKLPAEAEYILESYIRGDEIIAVGIVHDKKFHLIDITDKKTVPLPYFADILHASPSKHYGLFEKITEIGQSIAESFEIQNSPLIIEMIVSKTGELHVIEAVPEFGGEFLSDVLIPHRTGYNMIRESIKAVTGTDFRAPSNKKNSSSVIIKYLTGKKGRLESMDSEGPKSCKGVVFYRVFKKPGALIKKPSSNHDRIGVVAVKARSTEEALIQAEKALQSYKITIN